MKKQILLLLVLLIIPNCFWFGKNSYDELKNASKDALKETTIKGEIQLNGEQPVTGTLVAKMENKGGGSGSNNGTDKRNEPPMVIQLWNMMWLQFILSVLITWIASAKFGLLFANTAKMFISVVVNILIILVWEGLIYLHWVKYNHFLDIIATGVIACIAANVLYSLFAKKGYKQLFGVKLPEVMK